MNIRDSLGFLNFLAALVNVSSGNRSKALHLAFEIISVSDLQKLLIYLLLHTDHCAEKLLTQVRFKGVNQLIVVVQSKLVSALEADKDMSDQVTVPLQITNFRQHFDHFLVEGHSRIRGEGKSADSLLVIPRVGVDFAFLSGFERLHAH